MKNSLYKKGVVFGIIVVMLLIVPSTLATFTPNEVKTLNNKSNSEDKPDLVIQDVIFEWHYLLWHSYVVVLNQGTANVHGYQGFAIRIVAFRTLIPIKTLDDIYRFGGAPMQPGERRFLNLPDYVPRGFGFYKVYYMVDPDDEIDESNENNNVIWANFKLVSYDVKPIRTSDWHQVSKIPGSMPLNIPLILKQLPLDVSMSRNRQLPNTSLIMRILEQFPLLERLLSLVRV